MAGHLPPPLPAPRKREPLASEVDEEILSTSCPLYDPLREALTSSPPVVLDDDFVALDPEPPPSPKRSALRRAGWSVLCVAAGVGLTLLASSAVGTRTSSAAAADTPGVVDETPASRANATEKKPAQAEAKVADTSSKPAAASNDKPSERATEQTADARSETEQRSATEQRSTSQSQTAARTEASTSRAPTAGWAAPKPSQAKTAEAEELPAFDRQAARSALSGAAGVAAGCGDGEAGSVPVTVTFAPSGRATTAVLQGSQFLGTKAGSCIARAMRNARVPAFAGSHVTVRTRVSVN